jgi:nuclear pore complex protein Nup53
MVCFVAWYNKNRSLILAQSTSQSNVRVLAPLSQRLLTCFTQNVPPGNQRVDEVPVVQTKAKMNKILSRDSTTDFGMDSMFQSSRFV